MKNLNTNDLKLGDIYYYSPADMVESWIFIFKGIDNNTRGIDTHYNEFSTSYSFGFKPSRILREATPEEKDWLNACIRAGRFIPRDSISDVSTLDIF